MIIRLTKIQVNCIKTSYSYILEKVQKIFTISNKSQEVILCQDIDKEILINVSVDIKDESTKQREIKGLFEAMNYFNLNISYLITKDEDTTLEIENKKIVVKPLYKWLIEDI